MASASTARPASAPSTELAELGLVVPSPPRDGLGSGGGVADTGAILPGSSGALPPGA